jgi:hypothetical protein
MTPNIAKLLSDLAIGIFSLVILSAAKDLSCQ